MQKSKPRPSTKTKMEEIERLRDQGLDREAIAKHFVWTRRELSNFLFNHGVDLPSDKVYRTSAEREALIDKIRELDQQGLDKREIAKEVGLTRRDFYNFTWAHDVLNNNHGRFRKTVETIQRIQDLRGQGLNRKEIAAALGWKLRKLGTYIVDHDLNIPADPRNEIDPAFIEIIRDMAGKGFTQSQIAEHLTNLRGRTITQPRIARHMARHKIVPANRVLPPIRGWVDLEPVTPARNWKTAKLFL